MIEERQNRIFDLATQGFTAVAIAKLVGLRRQTVSLDIAAEAQRRASERSADRTANIEKNLAALERIVVESNMRVRRLISDAEASDNPHIAANLRRVVPSEVLLQLKSCEQQAKILGLLAPLQVDVSGSKEVEDLRARLWQAENTLRLRDLAEQCERFINGESDELPQC